MGTGIASVSNDGYSESYKITTAAEKDAELLTIAVLKNKIEQQGEKA